MILWRGSLYTRQDVWSALFKEAAYPLDGDWFTQYAVVQNKLVVFEDLTLDLQQVAPSKQRFNASDGTLVWYGKPNAHSATDTFRKVLEGSLQLVVFARWSPVENEYCYLGVPEIISVNDWVVASQGTRTIELVLKFEDSRLKGFPGPDGEIEEHLEGASYRVEINKYERSPRLRALCIQHHGAACKICGFDFGKRYGEFGAGFCHVHHIRPLSVTKSEHEVDPVTDLIPVCPNCHAMLHREVEVKSPDFIRRLIKESEK